MQGKLPNEKRVCFRLPAPLWEKLNERAVPSKSIRAMLNDHFRFEKLLAQARELATRYKISQLIVAVRGQHAEKPETVDRV